MTKEELEKLVEDKVTAKVDPYIKDQLKEQLTDAVAKVKAELKPDPVIVEAEEKAKGFSRFSDFLCSVWLKRNRGKDDPRLTYIAGTVTKGISGEAIKTAGHMEIGDDAQGGYLVPEVYRMELQEIALEGAVVRPRATILPMISDSLKFPYVNDTSHATNVKGGVAVYWTAEAAAKTATKPTFGQMELTPHKLAGLTYTSNELLADSAIALEPLITRMFGEAMGYFEDDAFLQGTGAGQPLGVFNCGCLKSVFRNTQNRVMYEDLVEMYQSLLPGSFGRAIWTISPTVMAELLELGSGNAADASGKVLIWQTNAIPAPTWTIFGRPVIISEKLQALGTAGDILLADFSYYLIGDRQPITIDASAHVGFTTDETAWRFVLRVAGQCWPQTTMTSRRGAHTYSPFIQLAATTS